MIPEEFHAKSFTQHRETVLQNSFTSDTILSAADWFKHFDPDEPVSEERLNDLNFFGYYRWYPMQSQNIAIVGTNPRFDPSGPEDSVFDFSACAGDFPAIRNLSMNTMHDYFVRNWAAFTGKKKGGGSGVAAGLVEVLAEETDIISREVYDDESYYTEGIYDDVYYTNLFKFGTDDFSDLSEEDWVADLVTPLLKEELDIIDPEVVLMLGDVYSTVTGESIQVSKEHGSHKTFAGYDVVPVTHPSRYGGNLSGNADGATRRYRETIRKLT